MRAVLLLAIVLLAACDSKEVYLAPGELPKGLEDCRVFEVYLSSSTHTVFRCPGATTTDSAMHGKVRKSTVYVEQ